MHRIRWNVTVIAVLICFCGAGSAQKKPFLPGIIGDFAGILDQYHVRLDLQEDASGRLTGTLYSVDLGSHDACSDLLRSGTRLSFVVPTLAASYEGRVSADGNAIAGTWNHQSPLTLRRLPLQNASSLRKQIIATDAMAASAFAKNQIGSLTVGVQSGDQLIWTKSYGNADMEKHLAADAQTVYRIGSVTKMFTGLMLEQLAESGKVHLSDPVSRYFPAIDEVQDRLPNAAPITLIELATHTAGLSEEPDDADKYVHGATDEWKTTLESALPHVHQVMEPGTGYSYSNVGYAILGAALEQAASDPFLDYIPRHIFEPLHMNHSSLQTNPEILPHLARGYLLRDGKVDAQLPQREHEGRGYKVPNGAAYTTVADLSKFASFLLGNGPAKVLKTASLDVYLNQLMLSSSSQLAFGYGLGFEVLRRRSYVALGHEGDVDGYQAAFYLNRQQRLGVIVLANATGDGTVDTSDIALRALDLISQ